MRSPSLRTLCPACQLAPVSASAGHWGDCGNCASQFLFPVLSASENNRLAATSPVESNEATDGPSRLSAAAELQATLPRGASVLDLGCGDGERVSAFKGTGMKIFAVDGRETARDLVSDALGNEVAIVESLDDVVPHQFDLIFLDGALSRAFNPADVLYRLFSLGAIVPASRLSIRVAQASPGEDTRATAGVVSRYSADGFVALLKRLHFAIDSIAEDGTCLDVRASGSDFAAFMQERYVPGTWSKLAEYEHLPRYQLALSACRDKAVLDFGSGTGYGTALLASVAASALGVDIDREAVAFATATHPNPKLKFDLRDDFGAGLPARSFDVITCFEMIEHVAEPEQIKTVASLARLLRDDGLLFMSTPNPDITAQYGSNPFHLREMTKGQFTRLLESAFENVATQDQCVMTAVTITEAESNRWRSLESSFLNAGDGAVPIAFIARASHGPLGEPSDRVMFDRETDLVRTYLEREKSLNFLKFRAYQLREELHEADSRWRAGRGPKESPDILTEQIGVLRAQLGVRHAQLDASRRQYQDAQQRLVATQRRLAAFHGSRLFLLGRALKERPHTVGKLVLACKLVLGMLLPESFLQRYGRNTPAAAIAQSAIDGERAQRAASKPTTRDGYQVKMPTEVAANRPRVLHAIANVMTGGSSRLVVDLVEHLSDQYEQLVLTGFAPRPASYEGLAVVEVPEPMAPFAIDAAIEKFNPDLVHVHYWGDVDESWYATVFDAAIVSGKPIVQNINTPVHPYSTRAARNVFVSEYVHRIFGDADPNARVIYPGSDLSLFSRSPGETAPGDCVGMVYRLEADKLNLQSIEPFIEIVRQRPATRALIVGGGTFLEAYKARVAEAGLTASFEFPGYVNYAELPHYYRRISVLLAPVWKESFGQVTPFAMSMAIPVIGYDVGAISEIVADPALVAQPDDAKQLASIAIALLDDDARRIDIGKRNQARAAELFALDTMISEYRSLYAETLQGRR